MKLSLKSGEHIRLAADNPAGTFRVYFADNILHVTANDAEVPGEVTIVAAADRVRVCVVPQGRLAAEARMEGVPA